MKILMINYEFPPILGGAANATRYISKELVLCGNDVTVVTSRVKGALEFELLDGVKVFRLPVFIKNTHKTSLLEMVRFLILEVKKANSLCRRENYDLIHYFFSIPTGIASFLSAGNIRLLFCFAALMFQDTIALLLVFCINCLSQSMYLSGRGQGE